MTAADAPGVVDDSGVGSSGDGGAGEALAGVDAPPVAGDALGGADVPAQPLTSMPVAIARPRLAAAQCLLAMPAV